MSRMQGRGRGRGARNGSGRGYGRGNQRSFKSNNNKPVKTKLEDHVFHVGTAKQASDFDTNQRFIVNHIREDFDNYSDDIANALEELKHLDSEEWKPKTSAFEI